MGPVALQHVGSSQTRARTRVPCISRQTLNHCATREAPSLAFIMRNFKYKKSTSLFSQPMVLVRSFPPSQPALGSCCNSLLWGMTDFPGRGDKWGCYQGGWVIKGSSGKGVIYKANPIGDLECVAGREFKYLICLGSMSLWDRETETETNWQAGRQASIFRPLPFSVCVLSWGDLSHDQKQLCFLPAFLSSTFIEHLLYTRTRYCYRSWGFNSEQTTPCPHGTNILVMDLGH